MLKRIRKKGKTVALESANRNYETKIFGPDRVKVQGILVSFDLLALGLPRNSGFSDDNQFWYDPF